MLPGLCVAQSFTCSSVNINICDFDATFITLGISGTYQSNETSTETCHSTALHKAARGHDHQAANRPSQKCHVGGMHRWGLSIQQFPLRTHQGVIPEAGRPLPLLWYALKCYHTWSGNEAHRQQSTPCSEHKPAPMARTCIPHTPCPCLWQQTSLFCIYWSKQQ